VTRERLCGSCWQRLGHLEPRTIEHLAQLHGTAVLFRRGLAMWIDLVPSVGLMLVMNKLAQATGLALPQWTAWFYFLGYYWLLEGLWGTSLGKGLMRLRVVDAQGRVPGLRKAALRTLARFFEANALLCGGLLALVVASSTRNRQRIGDKWAGTYVLRTEDLRNLAGPRTG
jgi:uncharacterized RDD family membrane protein YckC